MTEGSFWYAPGRFLSSADLKEDWRNMSCLFEVHVAFWLCLVTHGYLFRPVSWLPVRGSKRAHGVDVLDVRDA